MFEGYALNLTSADRGPAPGEFFEIRVPTRSAPVRIEYAAIRHLHSLLSGDNRSVGLLLGTASPEGLSVDDCELLPRESATAEMFLKARSEYPGHRVVGFFRTQPAGWPEMQESDREIARRCFQHAGSLFLLIQTPARRPWSAAFFDLGAERVSPSRTPAMEFFFDEYLLRNGYSTALAPMTEQQLLPEPEPVRRKTPWIAIGTIAVLLLVLLGVGSYLQFMNRNRIEPAAAVPVSSALSLKVVRSGKDFEISWDRSAPAVQQASGGTVTITDGALHRSLTLNSKQLREGRIIYSPLFADLTFRLEVQLGTRTQAESVQMLSWDTNPPSALPANLDSIPDPLLTTPPASSADSITPPGAAISNRAVTPANRPRIATPAPGLNPAPVAVPAQAGIVTNDSATNPSPASGQPK